jgi:hypothetical protein
LLPFYLQYFKPFGRLLHLAGCVRHLGGMMVSFRRIFEPTRPLVRDSEIIPRTGRRLAHGCSAFQELHSTWNFKFLHRCESNTFDREFRPFREIHLRPEDRGSSYAQDRNCHKSGDCSNPFGTTRACG